MTRLSHTHASPAHYIITGECNGCEPYTQESMGKCSLLEVGEQALELTQLGGKYGVERPRIFVFASGEFTEVTVQAAALVFEKWLEDADAEDNIPEWLEEHVHNADLHWTNERALRDEEADHIRTAYAGLHAKRRAA